MPCLRCSGSDRSIVTSTSCRFILMYVTVYFLMSSADSTIWGRSRHRVGHRDGHLRPERNERGAEEDEQILVIL